jgi:hypothetical protein
MEGFQLKLVLELVWLDLDWPLLTGGHYSEVAVSTGLTVYFLFGFLPTQQVCIVHRDVDVLFCVNNLIVITYH